jgi:hypothetical protein
MNPNLRLFIESGLALAVVVACWTVIRTSLRLHSVLKDYPPHRHEGDLVIYPNDFQPTAARPLRFGGKR